MIVDPDFLDHWRTRMLVDALGGDEMAPFYVLRIWGHCQQRHGDRFAMPAAGVKALCKATCGAAELEQALIDAGFIAREGSEIVVLKWAEKNASLLAAWENGNKGGRPKKKTQEKPSENPPVTETKPTANPDETQTKPIREEKRNTPQPPKGADGKLSFKAWLDHVKAKGEKPIPEGHTVFVYAEQVGIPSDFLRLHWIVFRERYCDVAKRYADWRRVFHNSVKGNWFRLWALVGDEYRLTTVGLQAQRQHAEAA